MEITHKEINKHLSGRVSEPPDAVYLIHGNSFLVEQAADAVIDALLPDPKDKSVYLETVDMAEGESIYEILERINTLSFFSHRKVIHIKADVLFASGSQPAKHLEKIEDARSSNDMAAAAGLLAKLMAKQQCDPVDIAEGDPAKVLNIKPETHVDLNWLKQVARYCVENDIAPADATDSGSILKDAIEKGFPPNHFVVITADTVDRRTALYKTVNTAHTIVNCSVASGSRKADVDQQKLVLRDLMQKTLSRHGKTADHEIFERIFELTGFEPRVFSGNLQKLIHFSGEASHITANDVEEVLDKSKDDPVFAFTGAIAEKNAQKALYFLSSLMGSGFHYMQLLSAVTGQIRRLLMVKLFIESSPGAWQAGMRFDQFKRQVMPAVLNYDQQLLAYSDRQAEQQAPPEKSEAKTAAPTGKSKKKAAGKAKSKSTGKFKSDLAIVKNPNNLYPVYQLFLQSDRFSAGGLKDVFIKLHDSDICLKTSGRTPKAVLEELVFYICFSNDRLTP